MELSVIYSSVFDKENAPNLDNATENVAIVIYQGKTIVYDTTGSTDVDADVMHMVKWLTRGCNYTYEFEVRMGNVYWFK